MKDISLGTFIKKNVEDDYAMNVFYYSVKNCFLERDFSLYGVSYFVIDGRFFGETIRISTKCGFRTPLHALAFLLSLRLLAMDSRYLKLCEDDSLIFVSKPRESFQWIFLMSLILDNWDDDEVKMLYQMMEDYGFDQNFSEDEKEMFRKTIDVPEYRNERLFYQNCAEKITGVSDNVIGDNAFLEADIEEYTISEDIEYVGNTAFSYCGRLKSLVFEGKVMFGSFPIIECPHLKQIIVPAEFVDYYKKCLSYYKGIITDVITPDPQKTVS